MPTITSPRSETIPLLRGQTLKFSVGGYGVASDSINDQPISIGPQGGTIGPFQVDANIYVNATSGDLNYSVIPAIPEWASPAYASDTPAGQEVNGYLNGPRGSMNIRNVRKIKRALAKLSLSTTSRINIGIHGMSIPFGWGSDNVSAYPNPAIAKTNSVASMLSKTINNDFGGVFTPGIDVVDNQSNIFTISGGAGYPVIYATPGPNGNVVNPAGGQVSFNVVGGRAGQVVRVYGLVSSLSAVNAFYSLTGANTATEVRSDASVPTGNILPNAVQHWFEYNITLANAGDTTVILKNAGLAPAGAITTNLLLIWAIDMDYRTDPGITVHRLCKPGRALVQTCAWPLDNTDTWPEGPTPAADWIGDDAATVNRRAGNLQSMVSRPALDLAICWFDINDCFVGPTGGLTVADHRRHIQNYVNGVNGLGVPVLFVVGIFRRPDTVPYPVTQDQVIAIYKEISDASPDVCGAAFLDLSSNLNANTQPQKYVEQWSDTTFRIGSEGVAPIHPNQLYSALFGQIIGSSITQAKNAI